MAVRVEQVPPGAVQQIAQVSWGGEAVIELRVDAPHRARQMLVEIPDQVRAQPAERLLGDPGCAHQSDGERDMRRTLSDPSHRGRPGGCKESVGRLPPDVAFPALSHRRDSGADLRSWRNRAARGAPTPALVTWLRSDGLSRLADDAIGEPITALGLQRCGPIIVARLSVAQQTADDAGRAR